MRTCGNSTCSVSIDHLNARAAYCSTTCKDTEKKRRKRGRPEFTQRELQAQRLAYQRNTAASSLGFTKREGYVGAMKAVGPRKRSPSHFDLFDDDDTSTPIFPEHTLPDPGAYDFVTFRVDFYEEYRQRFEGGTGSIR